jgi:hypothetical protein
MSNTALIVGITGQDRPLPGPTICSARAAGHQLREIVLKAEQPADELIASEATISLHLTLRKLPLPKQISTWRAILRRRRLEKRRADPTIRRSSRPTLRWAGLVLKSSFAGDCGTNDLSQLTALTQPESLPRATFRIPFVRKLKCS